MKRRLRKLVPLYLAAIAAGWACAEMGVPLPWMTGPLLCAMAFSLRFGEMPVPIWPRAAGQTVIASAIAINLTPGTMIHLAGNAGWMAAGGASVILVCLAIASLLVRLGGIDKATALFATLPGGPAEMALLAEKHGGQRALVAFLQTLRIAVIVTLVPVLVLLGDARPGAVMRAQVAIEPWRIVLVLAIAVAAALFVRRLRMVNAFFMGPLLGVGLATLAGAPVTALPWFLVIMAQFALGTSLGAMFTMAMFRNARRFLAYACWTALLLITATSCTGLAISRWSGQPPGLLILANAPGGATEMAVLAQSLGFDAALVTAYHVVRLLMITPMSELLFRLFRRLGPPR